MEDFRAHFAHEQGRAGHHHGHDTRSSVDSDRDHVFNAGPNSGAVVTRAPGERFRLGYFDVMCLVVNFMIGTGVFNSHTRVMQGTDSTGAALLLWLAGILYCLCGTHVYIEYGLNVPRYTLNRGIEQSVPRSGGDLNYLQYVYRKPAYRPNTVQLSTCLFGVGFIAFGNMAGNAISFASRAMRASGVEEPGNAEVRCIAIAVATLTCFIHAFSRRGGILLNNFFAVVKLSILLLIVVIAIVVGARGLDTKNVIGENTDPSEAFKAENTDANGYAHAFLAVIFSFWGFEQPNYIMGEIAHPKRKFPIAMTAGVVLICTLYMACTISYMVVVPKEMQKDASKSVAEYFFELTLGTLGPQVGNRVFNAFIAISSIGNMIVMTYTAARVKQEIAKEGILPYPRFFAQNTDLSLGRLLSYLRSKGHLSSLLNREDSWLLPEHHSEKTPGGAFVLHFLSCLILIFATWGMKADDAYELLTTLSVYVINCFFGFFIGLGILILRWKGPPVTDGAGGKEGRQEVRGKPSWRELTGPGINPYLSVFCASFFTLCNAWPVVTTWIPPTIKSMEGKLPWHLIPTIAWAVIGLGVAWYLGFLTVARHRGKKYQEVFVVEKKPEFESDGGKSGEGLVLIHETTYLAWVGRETLQSQDSGMESDGGGMRNNDFAGTDFGEFFRQQQQVAPPAATFQAQVHPPVSQVSLHEPRPYQRPQEHFYPRSERHGDGSHPRVYTIDSYRQ